MLSQWSVCEYVGSNPSRDFDDPGSWLERWRGSASRVQNVIGSLRAGNPGSTFRIRAKS